MMNKISTTILCCLISPILYANAGWQQRVEYRMEIDFDVHTHTYDGTQQLTLYNNSPDTLTRAFYHLYYNAFQPNSAMDTRSRNVIDPDPRVRDRIQDLSADQIGYQKVRRMVQDGRAVAFEVNGTILEAELPAPVLPGQKTVFEMDFSAQVPLLIRRAGRDSEEDVAYSMAQWYPKLCAYDEDGWHPDPYVNNEFYGEFGDFEVFLTIDKDYTVGGTGYLRNADEIGHGYTDRKVSIPEDQEDLTWHFYAPGVHDFMWAADPEYVHDIHTAADGTELHFFYKRNTSSITAWQRLPLVMDDALQYINRRFGQYPYAQFSFVHGGDGGMEYPMATLITGDRSFRSLLGTAVHELLHNWYYGVLGTNESLYPWMDEGFVSYAEQCVINELKRLGHLDGEWQENPFIGTYERYVEFAVSGWEEPMTTHSDHYRTNTSYYYAAYVKGRIFLNQLEYIIGKEAFDKTMLRYFDTWKFRHPRPADFVRVAEKCSGMVLDWYSEYWINTTNVIDYGLGEIEDQGKTTRVMLQRLQAMPMPVELVVTDDKGKTTTYYIPIDLMRSHKQPPGNGQWVVLEDWGWVYPEYEVVIPMKLKKIKRIEIDAGYGTADIDRENNVFSSSNGKS